MSEFVISKHAREELERRAIPETLLQEVLSQPQQIVAEREERAVYQSVLEFPNGRSFLLRVVLTQATTPPTVITVYRTSNIGKYWRQS